jgi:hypothetical protein
MRHFMPRAALRAFAIEPRQNGERVDVVQQNVDPVVPDGPGVTARGARQESVHVVATKTPMATRCPDAAQSP